MSRCTPLARFCVLILAVLLFLQSLRALFPLALFQPGLWWGTTTQLGIAVHIILLFLVPLTTPLLVRLLGEARTLKVALGGLALLRLLAQFAPNEGVRIVVISGAIACALWALSLGLRYVRSSGDGARFAVGLLLAFALDAVLNGAFYTWDYLWQQNLAATAVASAVSIVLLISTHLSAVQDDNVQGAVQPRAVWMLAPFFALHVTCLSNVAFVASNTGWGVPLATGLVLAGSAIGLVVGVQ